MNKHMRKFVALSLAVMMGTFGFLENSSQKVIADVVESTVESVETAINETTEDVTTTDEQTSKIVNETTESVNVETDKKTVETKNDNDVTETKEESNVSDKDKKISPTLHSSGTINIHRTSNGNPVFSGKFELFGVKNNGESYTELPQFEGMKFYSHGVKYTDEKGNVTFDDVSLDEDEWYFVKDLSNDNVINVGALPYYFNSKPTEGRIEKNDDTYLLYDINFNVTDKKAEITNLPKDEEKTIMPLLLEANPVEASLQANSSKYKWSYKLYSSTKERKETKITGRADFYHGAGSNSTQASIFKVTGVYAVCSQHSKSTTSTGSIIYESVYKGANAESVRKLLYYGYGGYDHGKTLIKKLGYKPTASSLAFCTIVSTSAYYSGQSCWESWNLMQNLRSIAKAQDDPADSATAATKIKFLNSKGKNVANVDAHLAADDKDYSNKNYYYSNWITVKSDGKKGITFGKVTGVTAYKKSGKNVSSAKGLSEITVHSGDKLKFRFDKTKVKSGETASVKMTSEAGITNLYAIIGVCKENYKQNVMREYISTNGDETDKITFTMPTEVKEKPPKFNSVQLRDNFSHEITAEKKDRKTGELLGNATIVVTNDAGAKKTVITNSSGTGKVTFTYSYKTKSYMYITNPGELTEKQIQNEVKKGCYKNATEANAAAKKEAKELENVGKTYKLQEISAPANYKMDKTVQTTTLKGKDKKVKITFYDDAEEIQTGVATYGTYYYQEVDVGKVDLKNTSHVLSGVQFQIYPLEFGNGSSLVEILYSDENNGTHIIKDETGIDTTLTTSTDGYDTSSDEKMKFYSQNARTGQMVVNSKTNANGVIRVGYVYKLQAVGAYNYIKNYDSLNNTQKMVADRLISEGYYKNETDALEAAKREVKATIEAIANRYHAWENPVGINNPYDDKQYWGITQYVDALRTDMLIRDTSTIKEYAEIGINDAETMFEKKKNIVASDENIFKYGN